MDSMMSMLSLSSVNQTQTYMAVLDNVQHDYVHLNIVEQLWTAWYAWMKNDTLATGIMSFLLHETVYFGRSLPWIIIGMIPFFDKWKLQREKHPTWKEQLHCSAVVLFSHCTVELPQIWLFHPFAIACGMAYEAPFPTFWTMAYQIAIFFVIEDAWHYAFHRALHIGPLYKHIHKMHHNFSAPFGLAAEYASPIETMLLGIGVVFTPVLWAYLTNDLHLMTMYLWITLRLMQAIDAHSGYDFPWSLRRFFPWWGGAKHHDLHHEKFIGNYSSSFTWLDSFFDTEAGPEAQKRRREKRIAQLKKQKAQ